MTRAAEIARGRAALGVMLLIVAFLLLSRRAGAGYMVLVFGWVFFGCGGGTLPLRKVTWPGLLMILFGLFLMALAVWWWFIYLEAWLVPLAECITLVGLVSLTCWRS
jgi:hypothetical protein